MKGKPHKVLRPSRAVIVVVAHGLSEVAIAESLGSALRMKIIVIAEAKGRQSIQIEGLAQRLEKVPWLRSQKVFAQATGLRQLSDLHIFTLMDVDDVRHPEVERDYLNGQIAGMTKRWYQAAITPIFCDGNLEAVLKAIDMPYAHSKGEKSAVYLKIFPVAHTLAEQRSKRADFEAFQRKLAPLTNTNLELFVQQCLALSQLH